MTGYVIRRLIGVVVVIFLLSFISFMLVNAFPGTRRSGCCRGSAGGVADRGGDRAVQPAAGPGQAGLRALRELALERGAGESGALVRTSESVVDEIGLRLPRSIELVLLASVISFLIAIPAGIISAMRQDSAADYAGRIFTILGLAIPNFLLAILVVTFVAEWVGVSLATLDSPYFWDDPLQNLAAMIGPALVLSASMMATLMRMQRSQMLEAVHEDYVRTARAKGLNERAVVLRHALRNSFIPVLTIFANQAAFLISGAVIIEYIFRVNGVGALLVTAIRRADFNVVVVVVVLGFGVVLINLLVDLSYAAIDPRIRYG